MEERKVKQVIVIRKDLGMRKGKTVSQGAHASLGALLKEFSIGEDESGLISYKCSFEKNSILDRWLNGIFTKICLSVDSEKELIELYDTIKENAPMIPCVMIEDCGLTEFHGEKTKTCVGIGPFWADEIDKFTSHLKLL